MVKVDLERSKFSTSALDIVNGQLLSPAALPLGNRIDSHCAGIWLGPRACFNRFRENKLSEGSNPNSSIAFSMSSRRPNRVATLSHFLLFMVYTRITTVTVAETLKVC